MGRKERYTIEQVQDALERAGGVRTVAARYLGCSRECVQGYIRRHPELQRAEAGISEELVDLAETQLQKAVREGKWAAVKFVLETKGAERGWVAKKETSGTYTIQTADGLTDEQLEAILRRTEPGASPDSVH